MIKNQQWIFGAIERGSRKVFLKCVQNRNSETLLELIREVIQPGTTIVSDLWRAYAGIDTLPEGYTHWTINHSENFVDPDNRLAHTQGVESNWQKFKAGHKNRYGNLFSFAK